MNHIDSLATLSRKTLASALSCPAKNSLGKNRAPLAVDCTAGNGHDTLFLAERCGPSGHVWAFDVQQTALDTTEKRLHDAGLAERVTLIPYGHEELESYLPATAAGNIQAAVFNLGFLPGSDQKTVTQARTTLIALNMLAILLAPRGVLCVHCYTGHPGGKDEGEAVAAWFAALPWKLWRVASYAMVNKQVNAETLFLAERRQCTAE